MDDNCGEWVKCMGVASGCGEQEVGVASGSGWNLWVWLLGVVLRRYIDFFILLISTPLVSVLFAAASLLFCSFFKCFFILCLFIYFVIRCAMNIIRSCMKKQPCFGLCLSLCQCAPAFLVIIG